MSKKFWFLTKQSLLKKIKTKTFIIVNILLLIAFASLMNIDRIVLFFGGNFNNENNVMVVDNTYKSYDIFSDNIKKSMIIDNGSKFKITKLNTIDRKKIKKDEDIIIVINNSKENTIDVDMITYGYIDSSVYQILINSLNKTKQTLAIENLNISKEELAKINQNVSVKREYIQKGKNEKEENMEYILSIITPIIIFPFFMLVTLVIQMIGAEINEEKSTRSMEIIISNVSAKVHFFSKVLASNLFVIIQCVLFMIYSFVGALIRGGVPKVENINNVGQISKITNMINDTGIFNNVFNYIPFILILMLITLLGYSLLAGILASMTTNMEDFQQLQTPMMVILLVGFYISIMSSMFDGSLFIRIVSYIPFVSAIVSPSLLLSGVIGIKDIILSTLLMIVVIYLLIKYGLKIYKEGILNYSSNKLWKKMFKALKEKN